MSAIESLRSAVAPVTRCLLLIMLACGSVSSGVADNASVRSIERDRFTLHIDGELLTLDAQNASLAAIVEDLAALTGIPITFSEPFDPQVSINARDLDLESLVSQLVPNSLITKLDFQSHIQIAEILLLPEGKEGDNPAALPSGEPAEAVVVGGDAVTPESSQELPESPQTSTEAEAATAATLEGSGNNTSNPTDTGGQ